MTRHRRGRHVLWHTDTGAKPPGQSILQQPVGGVPELPLDGRPHRLQRALPLAELVDVEALVVRRTHDLPCDGVPERIMPEVRLARRRIGELVDEPADGAVRNAVPLCLAGRFCLMHSACRPPPHSP
ncbi:hypothetical protein ACFYWU_41185 [Streptomyces chrestomyceticus]|uniref:hypothetical protein n=1 Tax=Streptomyces chrestomyceticus TaxID=68185 RepID=UPI003685E9B3